MAIFASVGRRGTRNGSGSRPLQPGFEALADALAFDGSAVAAAAEIGHASAASGASLDELLGEVAECCLTVGVTEPPFAVVRAAAVAWSEASLRYLHGQSCDDPLTGLASLSHLRSRLAELYRQASFTGRSITDTHAFVIVESRPPHETGEGRVDRALWMAEVSECLRSVYAGGETLGRLTDVRAAALVERTDQLGESITVLRSLLLDWRVDEVAPRPRVWIEGLPASQDSAIALLDELAR
jgi:hypothetical protein